MKKIILCILTVVLLLLLFTACTNGQNAVSPEPDPQPSSDGDPLALCSHEWALTAFVTEETDIPFAGVFTCALCKQEETRSFSYTDIDIPLISVEGGIESIYESEESMSKDNKVEASFAYQSADFCLETTAAFTYQGKSSKGDPKKNYSVNLLDRETGKKLKVAFCDSWGAGSKYVLKANWIDPSGVRNISMASLYGQVAHTRESEDPFSSLVNGGAVDGYPVLFYLNGTYQGLYNWVIRKDKWLYGMGDDDALQAVLCGSAIYEFEDEEGIKLPTEGMQTSKSWKFEYINELLWDEETAVSSFNTMLSAVKSASKASLRDVIAEYTILDRMLDVVLFSVLFGAVDNITGNQVWCTYDGKRWTPVPYDLDRTLGRNGELLMEADESLVEVLKENMLYMMIFRAFFEEIKERYFTLREQILTTDNIMAIFEEKLKGVDDRYFVAECEKWTEGDWHFSINASEIKGFQSELDYIKSYLDARFLFCDVFFTTNTEASVTAILN